MQAPRLIANEVSVEKGRRPKGILKSIWRSLSLSDQTSCHPRVMELFNRLLSSIIASCPAKAVSNFPALSITSLPARGNRLDLIFLSPGRDRQLFLKTLRVTCEQTDVGIRAWLLMDCHCHLGFEVT